MSGLYVVPGVRPAERRTEQVNVRLRPSERERLEQEAQRAGYRHLGEYLRDLATARSAP